LKNDWSNIEVSPDDRELIEINRIEADLGKLPDGISKIRNLITRFEICHFKYQRHMELIKESILNLKTALEPDAIGRNHIRYGESAWKRDGSGRSQLGQKYLRALEDWLDEAPKKKHMDFKNEKLRQQVHMSLGEPAVEKIRLIRLLLARLTWDWASLEDLQKGGEFEKLEFQICRMDICHYDFPSNLDRLLKGIGLMTAMENFAGCGSVNRDIQSHIKQELSELNAAFSSRLDPAESDPEARVKLWLTACFVKTIKEQAGLSEPCLKFY
jgi:hypothetical protein